MTHFTHTDRPFCASLELAAEHCQYERNRGRSPAEVIEAVGRPIPAQPTWKDARHAVAAAWIEMSIPSTEVAS